jgi:hypothetical protein
MTRICCCWLLLVSAAVQAADLSGPLQTLHKLGPKGEGNPQATEAWKQLSQADISQLPELLAGLDGANPLAANYIRAAIEAVAERHVQRGGKLPLAALEKYVLDTRHEPRGRRLAFEWLTRGDSTAPDRLIPGMLHDPSIEFRRDAVARLLEEAAPLYEAKKFDAAVPLYRKAFGGARDLDQIELIAKRLREMDQTVDLPTHFGFLMQWKLIGPFDNTDKKGYAIDYPPEKELKFDAAYAGKTDTIKWFDHTTTDDHGMVDLNKAIGKHMGAVGYAVAFFESPRERKVQLRLGCINANKLWLNGKLLHEREVYHANTGIDQYIAEGTLKPGRNVILLKVCQNEQTEMWAQNWQFQLRVCDAVGTAILAADRSAAVEAGR